MCISGDNGLVVFLQALSYSSSRDGGASQVYGKISICFTIAAILSVVGVVLAFIIFYATVVTSSRQ